MKISEDKMNKELEKAREKNKNKIKEIEILTNKYDELESQIKSINKKETHLKSKVVHLETDNDHYLNKIHQYEEEVTELKNNLENTIENLITTQNDFEDYKNKKEEEIERLQKLLKEEKDNVTALSSKKININIKNRNPSKSITLPKPIENDYEELWNEENKFLTKRRFSWGEKENSDKMDGDTSENEVNEKTKESSLNELDKEQAPPKERSRARNSRALTVLNVKLSPADVISKLRKRKEELVELNKQIKKEAEKLKLK